MATPLYIKQGILSVSLWNATASSSRRWNSFDSSRGITPGASAIEVSTALGILDPSIGSGTGVGLTTNTVAGPTAGINLTSSGSDAFMFFSPPVAADVTISGTVTFNLCGSENNMSANTTFVVAVYRVDEDGILTQIVKSALGTELGTSNSRNTWTATPTSTLVKKGHRLLAIVLLDDATSLTMGASFVCTLLAGGSNANTADSNVTFNETITFITSEPTGTTFWLRDTASDLTGKKKLALSIGSGGSTAVHTTLSGPITYPGDQWTATAGGSDIEWITAPLDAFTLGGVVQAFIEWNDPLISSSSPFDALVMEIAITNNDGSSPVVWARSYTLGSTSTPALYDYHLSGPDTSIGQGKRLRFRLYSDDYRPNNQVSGTNRSMGYDGTGAAEAKLIFSQTITEATTNFQLGGGVIKL